jgi:hypothetical protein
MSGVEFRKPLNPCDLSTPALVPFRDPGSWSLEPLHGKCYAAATEPGIERMVPWFIGLHCLVTVQRIVAKKRPSSQRPGQHGRLAVNAQAQLNISRHPSRFPASPRPHKSLRSRSAGVGPPQAREGSLFLVESSEPRTDHASLPSLLTKTLLLSRSLAAVQPALHLVQPAQSETALLSLK